MVRWIVGAGLSALIAIPAIAQAPAKTDMPERWAPETRADVEAKVKAHFAEMDANKDGAVTREEADAYKASRKSEKRDARFGMMDANKDGNISRDEFGAAHDGKGRGGKH